MVSVTLPLRLISGANVREHWAVRNKRAGAHRSACVAVPRHPIPCVVTLTRLGPRELDDDNLAISAKHVRDGIADRLGVNDNDKRVEWRYRQEKSKEYGVRVEIDLVGPIEYRDDATGEVRLFWPMATRRMTLEQLRELYLGPDA